MTTRRNPEMEKYVTIAPVVQDGFPDAHHVFLQVTNQRFCVTPYACETKEDAEWTRDMLCVALAKVVADSAPKPIGAELFAKSVAVGETMRAEGENVDERGTNLPSDKEKEGP